MQLDERDKAYLWDMLDSALAVQDFVRGKTPNDYLTDRMLRSAVERNVEIIGEAARHVSDSVKEAHPEIPWRSIIGQRNILTHEYGEIRHENVWNVAARRIPELVVALQVLVSLEPESD